MFENSEITSWSDATTVILDNFTNLDKHRYPTIKSEISHGVLAR